MTARNDITGDAIQTKLNNDAYRNGWAAIFDVKVKPLEQLTSDERLALAHRWWAYCEFYLKELDIIPQFEEWYFSKSMEPDPTPSKKSGYGSPDDYAF